MDDARTIFEIPAENMAKFEAQIAKLSKKSVKLLGQEIKPFVFSHEEKELSDKLMHRVYSVMLTAEIPQIIGWTFVARLDHSNETGTVVRMVPNAGALPEQYRHAVSTTCDHCGHKRYRRDTFVIRCDETGEHKQVGSTCLQDFFGANDPSKIAKYAELLGYAYECGRGGEHFVGGDLRWLEVEEFCAHAAMAVASYGWVSAGAAYQNDRLTSTRERSFETMLHSVPKITPSPENYALAEEALAWAVSLRDQKAALSDWEHNINVVASATMMEARSAGLAASIVGVYWSNQQKAKAKAAPPVKANFGDFSGVIALFDVAGGNLKFPKLRLALDGKPIALSVARSGAAPGSLNITDGRPFGENTWYGRVTKQGEWQRPKQIDPMMSTALSGFLAEMSQDPAGTASKYGRMTGHCMFCNLPLTDDRSTEVGYGKVCASNWGLPWGKTAMKAVAA